MNSGLKKELSQIFGLGGLFFLARRSPKTAALFAGASVGFYLSSRRTEFDFRHKSVLITGGSRGLGLALAFELLEEGANLTLVARKLWELDKARELLLQKYPSASVHIAVADVTKHDQLAAAIRQTLNRYGTLDVLINNAGAISVGPFDAMQRKDFEAMLELHFYAVLESVKLVRPIFKLKGGGRIVNICSLGGRVSVPHMIPYGVSKFALAGLSQGLSAELRSENITVTTVYPTLLKTGSPIQAVFKGDHEKEFAWFNTADNFPGLTMPAPVAARKILQAVRNGDSETVLSYFGKARLLASSVFPETLNFMMQVLSGLMPNGISTRLQTGAQSRALFDRAWYLKPLKESAAQTEKELNQEPGADPAFNLGQKLH